MMKTLIPTLAAAIATAGLASSALAQDAISPGYWEMTNQIISPVPSKKVERRCIKPADVAKFMQGPENHIYRCTYPTRQVGGGKIRLVGACASKNRSFPITSEGVFTSDTLRIDAHIRMKLGGLTIPGHARTTARRIGDACPAETASR